MRLVVILTASDEQGDIIKGYRFGVNSHVRKPVEFAGFSATVAQLGLSWLPVNQPPL